MTHYDRRARSNGACLAAEQERRASNLVWIRNVRVSTAEIASWQLGPDFVENRTRRPRRPGAH
jgi:hypothetical protein